MQRLEPLDWLRGLMAFSILVYHSASAADLGWTTDASSVLGRLGVYGVSTFFVLSGLSMAHVYHNSMGDWRSVRFFLVRRAFRIWPLLTLVVAMAAGIAFLSGRPPYSFYQLAINVTGLFSFFDPGAYINVGAWSIGNEMVFYALTPPLLWLYAKNRRAGDIVVAVTVLIGAYFAFVLLPPQETLDATWAYYINPLNNLFLFTVGVALFFNFRNARPSLALRAAMFILPILAFVFYPVTGPQLNTMTGIDRMILSAIAILVVLAFYRAPPTLPMAIAWPLEKLGAISYGVYLIHPFAINVAMKLPLQSSPVLFVLAVAVISIGAAWVVYRVLERPMVKLGKRLTRPA